MLLNLAVSISFAAVSLAATTVTLPYTTYQGYTSSGLTIFKGIRYAAPPVGSLRWQKPQPPLTNFTIQDATTFGAVCPNSPVSYGPYGEGAPVPSTEDCLFLNVYTPSTTGKLPVMIYIHGGGYGAGDGTQDMTSFVNGNSNGLVAVTIQYRLGAFGFLPGAEVKANGVLNAGLLDQNFAMQWVQSYISKFGGDPTQVTIAGESAGAGSVMLHDLAYGGTLGTTLFQQSITASPYLPPQYNYNDPIPVNHYNAFATAAGCSIYPPSTGKTFACLVASNTTALQQASFKVSGSGNYGTWAFVPVTDGTFVQTRPSVGLLTQKLNGLNQLAGNNGQEGDIFVIPTISTTADLSNFVSQYYPNLTAIEKDLVLALYPTGPTTTPYQAAAAIYGEATFICPSYWLAEAYSLSIAPKYTSYKYQYSVTVPLHATDLFAYFGPPTPNLGPDFVAAFQQIWGNFIIKGNPSIPNTVANGPSSANPSAPNPASNWPVYSRLNPYMINLNETGGVLTPVVTEFGTTVNEYVEPGLKNAITLVNAATFENLRQARCDFWRIISPDVPE